MTEDAELRDQVVAINFVADAGKLMLESSTSVSEVVERLREFLPAVGLSGCSLDANMTSVILSFWQAGRPMPLTTMREVAVASPASSCWPARARCSTRCKPRRSPSTRPSSASLP